MFSPSCGWNSVSQGSQLQLSHGWNNRPSSVAAHWNTEEPTSLPLLGGNSKNFYQFEVGSSSSSSNSSLTRSHSSLSFSTKSKSYSWGLSPTTSWYRPEHARNLRHGPNTSTSRPSQATTNCTSRPSSCLNTPRTSSASSICSSESGVDRTVDWDRMVDKVFSEEVGECDQNRRIKQGWIGPHLSYHFGSGKIINLITIWGNERNSVRNQVTL